MSVYSSKSSPNEIRSNTADWFLEETVDKPLSPSVPTPSFLVDRPGQQSPSLVPLILTVIVVAATAVTFLALFFDYEERQLSHHMTVAAISGSGSTMPIVAQQGVGAIPLSQADQTNLLFMREEEKLARDVYAEMHRLWGMSIFKSISAKEQEHMDAMATLLQRYQLPDPVGGDVPGVFINPILKNLYQVLTQRGKQSVDEALKVCGLQEEINILDLDAAGQASSQADIKEVFSELQSNSFNHLRAFAHGLELRGTTYQGERLPPQTIEAIIHGHEGPGLVLR